MATKTRAKAKRKKATVTKKARRRKTVRKTRLMRKKAAKKAPPRRAARNKAKSTAKVASQRAQPEAVKPRPSRPAQPTAVEQQIGVVTHYYSHLSVVALQLEPGTKVRVGEVNHAPVTEVGSHDDFGLRAVEHAREHDIVYKV